MHRFVLCAKIALTLFVGWEFLGLPCQALTIDDFTNSSLGGSVSLGEVQTNDFAGLVGVLGGTRKGAILFTGNSIDPPFTAVVSFGVSGVSDPESGTLHFEAEGGPLATGLAKMVLDGTNTLGGVSFLGDGDTDFDGLGSIDLTEGGTQAGFQFDVELLNGAVSMTITVYDASANDGSSTSHTFAVSGAGNLNVPFSNFNSAILADAGAIALRVDLVSHEAEVRLESWNTYAVPEPTSFALAGLASIATIIASARQRR